uniref:Uncharacterized protein n=1 Tax=Arundo donax TaxID=35708 RepID=A0A0A8YT62_ARUDO
MDQLNKKLPSPTLSTVQTDHHVKQCKTANHEI